MTIELSELPKDVADECVMNFRAFQMAYVWLLRNEMGGVMGYLALRPDRLHPSSTVPFEPMLASFRYVDPDGPSVTLSVGDVTRVNFPS